MEKSTELFQNVYSHFMDAVPKLIMAAGFIIISVLVYKLVCWLVRKMMKLSKTERLNSKINETEFFENSNLKIDVTAVILGFVKLILLLIIFIIGSELMNLSVLSGQISRLLAYLPQLLSGILIFAIGIFIASKAKKETANMLKSVDSSGSKIISNIVFFLIFIFMGITAVNQIGIDTQIISTNLSYLIGAALVTVTLAVGLGSRDIIYRLLLGYYTKKNLKVGMTIQIDGLQGVIESIDNICLILRTDDQKLMLPIKKINNSQIRILSDPD